MKAVVKKAEVDTQTVDQIVTLFLDTPMEKNEFNALYHTI